MGLTPGNGISGIKGDVLLGTTQVAEIKKFSWNPKSLVKDYASNKTQGAKKRIPGVKDGSGSMEGVLDPWNPVWTQFDVGSIVTLTLQHMTGSVWTVPVIIETMKYDVDLDSGDIEGWSADFSIAGMWTNPTTLPATTAGLLPFAGGVPAEQATALPLPSYGPVPEQGLQGNQPFFGQQPAQQQFSAPAVPSESQTPIPTATSQPKTAWGGEPWPGGQVSPQRPSGQQVPQQQVSQQWDLEQISRAVAEVLARQNAR